MTGAHVLLIVTIAFTILLFGMEWVVNRLFESRFYFWLVEQLREWGL